MKNARTSAGVSLLLLLLLAGPAAAQTWIEITPGGGPSGDDFHIFSGTVAYDPATNRLVVFLARSFGFGHAGFPLNLTGDVWVLTNANGLGGTPVWIKLIKTRIA